ncbi:MAG: hypothetical protein ACREBG_27250 [Pyrinomonadaceae bacterium]
MSKLFALRFGELIKPLRRAPSFFGSAAVMVVVLCLGAVIALTGNTALIKGNVDDGDDRADACRRTRGPTAALPTTKLFIEHNSTNADTGVHGAFDGLEWTKLCVYDPHGRQVLEVEPKRQLRTQAISGIFFESAEPPNDEVPIADILARFPAGLYSVRGLTLDGKRITGAATFTHDIPAAPVITFPLDGAVVSPSSLVVMWNHVTTTLTGAPLNRTGYEVIITKDVPDDPHGFSLPTFDVHVLPSQTSLTVPTEFLEPGTAYELEVLVLEVSGNQTISIIHFETQ